MDLAMVVRVDSDHEDKAMAYQPLMREVEMHVGLPGIVVHKGDCDAKLRHEFRSRVSANLNLLEAFATALHNAGIEDVPDRWFSAYGREDMQRLVPDVPPSDRTTFLDEKRLTWKVTQVDTEKRRVRLEAYMRREEEELDLTYEEFQERFTVLQNI